MEHALMEGQEGWFPFENMVPPSPSACVRRVSSRSYSQLQVVERCNMFVSNKISTRRLLYDCPESFSNLAAI